MKHRKLILTTLLAGSLAAAGFTGLSQAASYGGDNRCGHAERMSYGKHGHDPLRRLMKHVDLTDAQQAEIKTIMEADRDGMDNTREQLRDNRKAMRALATDAGYSIERVRELANQQAQLKSDLTVARIDRMHRVFQVLTPEQQAEMKAVREKREERNKERRDRQERDTD